MRKHALYNIVIYVYIISIYAEREREREDLRDLSEGPKGGRHLEDDPHHGRGHGTSKPPFV